jgi:hypothetical protein
MQLGFELPGRGTKTLHFRVKRQARRKSQVRRTEKNLDSGIGRNDRKSFPRPRQLANPTALSLPPIMAKSKKKRAGKPTAISVLVPPKAE